jgi:hypothetical protein
MPPPLKKTSGMKRRRKVSSWMGDKTLEQEVLLVKPLKLSKKFVAKEAEAHSSGLSVEEKASSVKTSFDLPLVAKSGSKKAPSAPIENDESGYMSTRVVNMVDTSVS